MIFEMKVLVEFDQLISNHFKGQRAQKNGFHSTLRLTLHVPSHEGFPVPEQH